MNALKTQILLKPIRHIRVEELLSKLFCLIIQFNHCKAKYLYSCQQHKLEVIKPNTFYSNATERIKRTDLIKD